MKTSTIYIFWVDTNSIISESELPDCGSLFLNQRQNINYQSFKQKKLSLFAKLLLKNGLKVMGEPTQQTLNYCTNGKPIFNDTTLSFSISHSGTLAACCIAKGFEVGLDLQEILPLKQGSEGVFLNKQEIALIAPADYLKTWCKKEAAYKGFGVEYAAKLTDFRYYADDKLQHSKGVVRVKEQKVLSNYLCYVAFEAKLNYNLKIMEVPISQLINGRHSA